MLLASELTSKIEVTPPQNLFKQVQFGVFLLSDEFEMACELRESENIIQGNIRP